MGRIRLIALLWAGLLLVRSVAGACGLSFDPLVWRFPRCDERGRVWMDTVLLEMQGADGRKIPLRAYWAPDDPRPSSLLGEGWRVPILESRCLPTGENTLKLWMPSGYVRTLTVGRADPTKKGGARSIVGPGWRGTLWRDGVIDLVAECGDTLRFRQGLASEMTMGKRRYSWIRAAGRLESFREGDRTLLTLDYGNDGRPSALRREDGISTRLIFGDVVSSDAGALVRRPGLVGLTGQDGRERRYVFAEKDGLPTIRFPEQDSDLVWDKVTTRVIRDGDWIYTIRDTTREDGGCAIRRTREGAMELYERRPSDGIVKNTDAKGIVRVTKSFTGNGPLAGLVNFEGIETAGELKIITEYNYDENGRLVRRLKNGKPDLYRIYDEAGRMTSQSGARGDYESYTYDDRGRMRTKSMARRSTLILYRGDADYAAWIARAKNPEMKQLLALRDTIEITRDAQGKLVPNIPLPPNTARGFKPGEIDDLMRGLE